MTRKAVVTQKRHLTLARGIMLLEAVSEERHGITVTELSRATGLEVSTTSRLVGSLCDFGYLAKLPDRRIVLTGRVLRLTRGFQDQFDLRELARPMLRELRDLVNETVILTIREGNFTVSIDQFDPSQRFRMVPHIGNIAPLHATAAGRSILFALPPSDQRRILAAVQEEPVEHPEVHLDDRTLAAEMERAKRNGYVWIRRSDDVERVAAVVLDSLGDPVAAVSIYGPQYRMQDRISELGQDCRRVAQAISSLARGTQTRTI